MTNILRNMIAVFAGIAIGAIVNMALVSLGPSLIPPPVGVDVNSAEGLASAMHLLEPRHFVMPLLAHALGTLAGALAAYLIATKRNVHLAYLVGLVFLCGGVGAGFMIPAPAWFIALDLVAAYIPMAWLGIQIGSRLKPETSVAAAPGARR